MEQIKIFSASSIDKLEERVNEFLGNHRNIIDVSYQFHPAISKYDKNGIPSKIECINRVLVVYEDV